VAPSASAEILQPAQVDIETLRAGMSQALLDGGHETAAYLLEAGKWEWNGTELRVQVAASKTLFEMMYPLQAQQIVREFFRQAAGSGSKLKLEPGDPTAAKDGAVRRKQASIATLENSARPQDHPLVRHAQQLFSAEIRSVVSLRDPQSSKSSVEGAPNGHGKN
jgi:hypothetical protein